MRKFFYFSGAACLALLVTAVIGIGVMIWNGRALDAESKAYVDAAVPAITAHWDRAALLDRASPELREKVTTEQIANLFENFSHLGPLIKYDGSKGQTNMVYSIGQGGRVTASYQARAEYENGDATLQINLLKRDGEWRILGFHVDGHAGARKSQSM